MGTLRRVRRSTSVTQRTYERLELAITRHRLVPGAALVVTELAQELGVSRTPVREALMLLERVGLVETLNGRATVAGLANHDLDEVFEFREMIELFCLRKLADNGNAATFKALRRVLDGGDASPEDAAVADISFHHSLVVLADNARLLEAWEQLATHLRRFWHDGRSDGRRGYADVRRCRAVIVALERRDASEASAVLLDHLRDARAALSRWRAASTESCDAASAPSDGA